MQDQLLILKLKGQISGDVPDMSCGLTEQGASIENIKQLSK
ncbi:Uncharacterized protein dnl_06640 [Desulfonema limicola]|uniref:Uncharacterized protein n=1 Tax=Desulfonema limicola TaxID=45656 RepID=A0A975B447_9BACT|nr:Uncharacterized protein dnl_06640 [Desulfonema limicola]